MNREATTSRLKALAGKVRFSELYTLAVISFGIPYVVYLYADLRAAIATFIASQVILGIVNLKVNA